jgi:hypothetical protein
MQNAGQKAGSGLGSPPCLFGFVVDRDFERAQEAMVLGGEFDFSGSLESALGLLILGSSDLFLIFLFFTLFATVEADGSFENQKDVVAGSLDFADRFCDPVRIGKGIVNRVSQFLHELLQWLFHNVSL